VEGISVDSLKLKMKKEGVNIIDIRDNYQYQLGHIKNARNVPMNFLLTSPDNYLRKDVTYYLCCEFGTRSNRCVRELNHLGYKTINILGGYQEYKLKSN